MTSMQAEFEMLNDAFGVLNEDDCTCEDGSCKTCRAVALTGAVQVRICVE